MKEAKQRVKPETTGRGTYTKQACNHCRRRKSKCDGKVPVCGPCRDTGRASECTWGKETAKKARTQQHFESLVNHIKALEAKVKDLEAELDVYHRNHGGTRATSSSSEIGASLYTRSVGVGEASSSKQEEDDQGLGEESDSPGESNGSDTNIDRLIAPTRHLVLQENDLELYGPTSIFRLAPERSSPSVGDERRHEHQSASPPPSSHYFDWSRHLPKEVPLSRAEHDKILDLLFKFFGCWGFRVVPELFLRDMHRALSIPSGETPPKSTHYSPMLHNAILALATAFSDNPSIRNNRIRDCFARKAKEYIETECPKPNLSVVNALNALASYHSSLGEQSLGYLYFGMSGRMSQALGLNIDCSAWVKSGLITHADMVDRNWVYWVTFSQDVCWSLYVGRDCCVSPPNENRPIPFPFVGSQVDQYPWYWAPCGIPSQPGYIASTFAASCQLLRIARKIMNFVNDFYPQSRRESHLQFVSEIDIQLNDWKDSLAPEVDLTAASKPTALPHRLMLHASYWWLFILLHRPFYRRPKSTSNGGPDIDHVKLCNRAAENIMNILALWHEKFSLRYTPITLVQVVFCAGTSFILSAVQATSGPRLGRVTLSTALSQVDQCIRYLSIVGKSWECANHVADILSSVLHEHLKPRLLMRPLDPVCNVFMAGPHLSARDIVAECNPNVREPRQLSVVLASSSGKSNNISEPFTATSIQSGWSFPERYQVPGDSPGDSPDFGVDGDHETTFESRPTDGLTDIPMDFSFPSMGVGIMDGQPLSNQPYITFGLPEPHLDSMLSPTDAQQQQQQQISLDFTAEEMAMMDQILRQQQFSHSMPLSTFQTPQ